MNIIEKIIGFVMSNPLIAIVIIGALFSAMGKGQKKGANNRMPDFGGSGQAGPAPTVEPAKQAESRRYDDEDDEMVTPIYTDTKGSMEQSRPSMAESYAEKRAKDANDRMSEMEQRLAGIERTAQNMSGMPSSSLDGRNNSRTMAASSSTREETHNSSDFVIDPKDALRGVAWAEILGPPRAKRPYGRRP